MQHSLAIQTIFSSNKSFCGFADLHKIVLRWLAYVFYYVRNIFVTVGSFRTFLAIVVVTYLYLHIAWCLVIKLYMPSPVTRLVPVGLGPPRKLLGPPEIRPTETCLALMLSVLSSHTAPMLLYTEANAPRAPNGPEWSLHEIRAGDGAGLTHGATNGIVRTSRRLPWYRVVLYNGMWTRKYR